MRLEHDGPITPAVTYACRRFDEGVYRYMPVPSPLFIAGAVMAFIFGITIGSFLNVCIYRLPLGESLVHPPSHCPSCHKRLRAIDLFPLFSFLLLRGKCRYCGKRISWRYFTIELITGLLFAACWMALARLYPLIMVDANYMLAPQGILLLVCAWAFMAAMLVTFVIDMDTTYVFEPVTWVGMAAGLIAEVTLKLSQGLPIRTEIGPLIIPYLPMAVPGMLIGFLVFVAMDLMGRLLFRKPGMGLGDAYIGAAIGAMLGPGLALLSFGVSVFVGAIVGVVLIILGALHPTPAPGAAESTSNGALQETDEELPQGRYMPFGPFLTASAMLIALAPQWVTVAAHRLLFWWMYKNPFL